MQTWLPAYIVATVCRISLALIWVPFPPITIFQYTPTRTRTDSVRNKYSFLTYCHEVDIFSFFCELQYYMRRFGSVPSLGAASLGMSPRVVL